MPELTRRLSWPDDKHATEDWSIYYGDILVGGISKRQGAPHSLDQWQWSVGFYPGRHPRDSITGTARTFEDAREAWARAWAGYLQDCTEAQFEEWRAWHAFRYGTKLTPPA